MVDREDWWSKVSDLLVPIHRDGHKFIAVSLALALLGFLVWSPLGWLFAIATGFLALFFRDPERVSPVRPGLVVAAADGKISGIETVRPPSELGIADTERTRVSIFIAPFNVHVIRAPAGGRIVRAAYVPGSFGKVAGKSAHQENERRAMVIETADKSEVGVVMIAGMFSRRIVAFAGEGDTLTIGQRLGLIRFGSRVDVYLPAGAVPLVAVGQTAIAGETVLCDVQSSETFRETKRD